MGIAEKVIKTQDRDKMLRRSLERLIRLYTDKSHFVYELLQNAEDAKATQIYFRQKSNCLEVFHNGMPFTIENLNALCDVGNSDKQKDLNKIGEFGVGFKSVFGICERVRLYSRGGKSENGVTPPFGIEIIDFTTPKDIPMEELPAVYTTKFIFPYCVGKEFSGYKDLGTLNKAICMRLKKLGVTALLFMHHLQSISFDIQIDGEKANGSYAIEKKQLTRLCCLVTTAGSGVNDDVSYLKYSKPIPGSTVTSRTVDIAYPVTIEKDGHISFHPNCSPYISVYFPTETESKLSFIVQGPYRTTPNRSSIPFDDEENVFLAKLTAELMHDSVLDVKNQGLLTLQFLALLPLSVPKQIENWLFEPLYDTACKLFQEYAIIPTAKGGWADAESVKIARGQELITLFPECDVLSQFIDNDDENMYFWAPPALTDTNRVLQGLYQFLTNTLGVEIVRPEGIYVKLKGNKSFLKKRTNIWLEKFYQYLEKNPSLVSRRNYSYSLLSVPFIKTANGDFIEPYRQNGGNLLPGVYLPIRGETQGFICVHPDLAKKCKSFFTDVLGLSEPDAYDWYKQSLIKKYSPENDNLSVDDEEYTQDISTIYGYLKNSKYTSDLSVVLNDLLYIQCDHNGESYYANPKKIDIYLCESDEGISISDYMAAQNSYFVNETFYAKHNISREMLSTLGVKSSLVVGRETCGWYYSGDGNAYWLDEGDFRSKLTFCKIEEVLTFIQKNPGTQESRRKSACIMQLLFTMEKHLKGVTIKGKTVMARVNALASIVYTLTCGNIYNSNNPKWLYDREGRLMNPSAISKFDLDISLYDHAKLDSKLYDILGFAHGEQDTIEETFTTIIRSDRAIQDDLLERLLINRWNISLPEAEKRLTLIKKDEESLDLFGDDETFSPIDDVQLDFPSSPIINHGNLIRAMEKQFISALPVKYEIREQSVRTSQNNEDNKSYLLNMYSYPDNHATHACQICMRPSCDVEVVQLESEPVFELKQMHVLLCPNCAAVFRRLRGDKSIYNGFLVELSQAKEDQNEPIQIKIGETAISFTATHLAEIMEMLRLLKNGSQIRYKKEELSATIMAISVNSITSSAVSIQQTKSVYHNKFGKGVIIQDNGKYVLVKFQGVGEKQFILEKALKDGYLRYEDIV